MNRNFRALSGAALAIALSAGSAIAADAIKVGVLPLMSHAPSFIAFEKGYYKEAGLDVKLEFFQAAQPMAVSIASGDVDFGVTAITGALINLAEKGAIKIIAGALTEADGIDGQKLLVAKAAFDGGLKTPAGLKGKRFGVTTAGSSFHYMAHKIADSAGVPRADMQIVPLQSLGAVSASLKTGQIDAWSITPNVAAVLTAGPEVVSIGKVSDHIKNYQVTTVFTSTKNVKDKRDLVQRFLTAFSKGVDDYNNAFVYKKMSDTDTKALVAMLHKHVYNDQPLEKADPQIRAGAMLIAPKGRLSLSSVKDQLEWFQSEKMVPAAVKLEDLVDRSFVEAN